MHRKDHFLKEIQKLAQMLARLLDLKKSGREPEYQSLLNDTLVEEYGLSVEQLQQLCIEKLKALLESSDYSAEKINTLAQILYAESEDKAGEEQQELYRKILVIFDVLEQKHHWQSFENIGIRNLITKSV